ncbi:MAG: hypothetical protein HYR85_17340 [Planctomycetes bacterium]|nr:hypothetical protein [Planctomycetota bacterium]
MSKRLLVGVALLSFCVLALEVALTRLFAWVLHNHFAFLAISLAICGLGLGAYGAHVLLGRTRATGPRRILMVSAYGFPIATLASLAITTRVVMPHFPSAFALVGALLLAPFLFAGAALAVLFREHSAAAAKLYAADLLGAALAAVGAIVLLDALGGIGAIVFVAGVAALLPLFFASRPGAGSIPAVGLAVVCSVLATMPSGRAILDVPLTKESLAPITERLVADEAYIREHGKLSRDSIQNVLKGLLVTLADPNSSAHILHTDWNAFGRTDVTANDGTPDILDVWLDGDVPALMRRGASVAPHADELRRHPAFLPYRLAPVKKVLSLGSGAGFDVVLAKLGGADTIDAVEINPAIPRVMDRFREFHGGVYDQPGVRLHVTDGRSFVKQTTERYDLVVLSLTQSATSGYSGTALMESYIHTQEACEEYLRCLGDRGMVMFIGGYSMHAYRWIATSAAALEHEMHVSPAEVARHLLLVEARGAAPYQYAVVTSRQPFDEAQRRVVAEVAVEPGVIVQLAPGDASPPPFDRLGLGDAASGPYVEFFREQSHVNVAPSCDDSPFFIDVSLKIPTPLWQLLGFALAVTLLFAGIALAATRAAAGGRAGALATGTAYFACLGIGFMLVEVGLIQRLLLLLGRPTHTVAVILFSMLLGAAIGSALVDRTPEPALHRRRIAGCVAVGVIALSLGLVVSPLADALLRASLAVRVVAAVGIGVSLGAAMGVPFPAGLRLAARERADSGSYLWGVNGVTSVVGSVLAAIAGRTFGFSVAILLGGGVYLVAAALALAESRGARSSDTTPRNLSAARNI